MTLSAVHQRIYFEILKLAHLKTDSTIFRRNREFSLKFLIKRNERDENNTQYLPSYSRREL